MKSYYLIFLIFIEIGFSNGLFINEFMAKNDTTNVDEAGEFDDWIEIYNAGTELQDIGGLFLTDNADNLTKWMIPEVTVIQSQNFLLFWCDEDQEQGELHTNFKLNTDGEFLALVNIDGVTILDSITFGPQSADISYGRVSDGDGEWQFMNPTPGITNTGELRINDNKVIPDQYTLYQNYPNPFNPVTTISFSMPISANVKIIAYDIIGNQVVTILNQTLPAGTQSVPWNAKNRPSGVYFIRMESGAFVRTQKIMLLK
ncbi:MAG: lamin tail domain-containing protein [Candidatus Marinimicrobia bacterium]|jgi:hypothetical protein|nr:lamin tail domain-containing protein [Candidatus Neomarinimicrobiota bacterium]MDP6260737.1 lamin tail domain-containing protein [Candidatus Neomarinimicrobiota bacterium]MDP7127312.1 lamin tail domain-containing protein [Candidatus Neomarinimicrobiota bacterium]MDP7475086.1 lamin tail domain-containing protein [Candidatus Neomarinimicrobiota bacterium]MEE1506573.1 lamin tail domain-containing protein [Candidatus Neomarinimicrobiota bacterium]|tara:strand:+ start:329 stop:1102 length:774 start_codon:yes stop_codon:yes gene_type:complete